MNTDFLKEEMEARERWLNYERKRYGLNDFYSALESDKVCDYMVENNSVEKRNILYGSSSWLDRDDIFQFKDVEPGKNLFIDFRRPLSTAGSLKKAYFTFVEVFRQNNDRLLECKGLKRFYLATLFFCQNMHIRKTDLVC